MPIAVNCRCGKQFRVPEEYAGKKIKCTSCGETRIVAAGAKNGMAKNGTAKSSTAQATLPAQATQAAVLKFQCDQCDHPMQTKAEFAGKKTKCPGCQAIVTIPSPEDESDLAEEVEEEETPKARIQAGKPQPKKAAKPPVEEDEEIEEADEEVAEEVDEEEERPKGRIQSGKSLKKAARKPAVDEDEEIEEAEADDEDEEDERPKKKSKKSLKKKSGMGLWIGIGAGALLLVVGGVVALIFMMGDKKEPPKIAKADPAPAGQQPPKGAVPPGQGPGQQPPKADVPAQGPPTDALTLIPGDAQGFVTVRVAEVANNPVVKDVLARIQQMGQDPVKEMQNAFGVAPTDLDRFTLVVQDGPKEQMWVVLSSTKPFDRNKVNQKLALDATERKHEGKAYQVSRDRSVIHFAGDRTIVFAPSDEAMKMALDLITGKRKGGGGKLQNAITLAGGKHQVVAGFVVPPELAMMLKQGPGVERAGPGPGVKPPALPGPGERPQPLPPGPGGKQPPRIGPGGRPLPPPPGGPGGRPLPPPGGPGGRPLPPPGGPGGRPQPGGPGGFGPDLTPLLEAQSGWATLDLNGNTVMLEVAGDFPDAAKAGKAKELLDQMLKAVPLMVFAMGLDPQAAKQIQESAKAVTIGQAGNTVTIKTSETIKNEDIAKLFEGMAAGAGRAQSTNNLKQIGLAFHNYASAMNGLCPDNIKGKDGKPLLSWRVAILPYVEEGELYSQFKLDEPWDSPNNIKLLSKMPRLYTMPGLPADGKTPYKLFTGPKTVYDGKKVTMPASMNLKGTSNLIAVVEAADPVEWTKPADIPFNPQGDVIKLLRFTAGVCNAAFWDGSVRQIRQTVDPQNLKNAILATEGGAYRD